MLEMVVSNGVDLLKVSRNTSAWGAGFLALIFGILPALSSSVLMNVRVLGYGLLEFLDSLLINWGLPLVGLGTCFFLDRYFHQEEFEKEFFHRESITSSILFPFWQKAIRRVIPSLIILGFVLRLCHAILG
jgi:SNF family Na+-dependent transporter